MIYCYTKLFNLFLLHVVDLASFFCKPTKVVVTSHLKKQIIKIGIQIDDHRPVTYVRHKTYTYNINYLMNKYLF